MRIVPSSMLFEPASSVSLSEGSIAIVAPVWSSGSRETLTLSESAAAAACREREGDRPARTTWLRTAVILRHIRAPCALGCLRARYPSERPAPVRPLASRPRVSPSSSSVAGAVGRPPKKRSRMACDHEEQPDRQQRDERRRSSQGIEVRPDRARERQPADRERQRVRRRVLEEHRTVVVVPHEREAEQERAEDPRPDQRQRHLAERPALVGAEIAGSFLDAGVIPVPDGDHDEEAERDAPDDVRSQRRLPDRRVLARSSPRRAACLQRAGNPAS